MLKLKIILTLQDAISTLTQEVLIIISYIYEKKKKIIYTYEKEIKI